DSVFLYLNKTSQKQKVLNGLLEELSDAFDKVIYINPQYTPNTITIKSYNVVKFCTHFANTARNQIISTLLGANYARRLIEMGKSVAIVIDDINSIMALDNEYTPEMPVSKTVLGSTKVTLNGGSNSFAIITLRSNDVNSYTLNSLFKSVETLGIVIENNEIDLFNSYRA
ncbi:MAG: hypothetical protein IJ371_04510, partial [Clostridia bacterium]|nr:hypothetical protein [Clostridia bacterium]